MSHWTHILSADELDARFTEIARINPGYAAQSRDFYATRNRQQLNSLMYRAWLDDDGERYQIARSFLAMIDPVAAAA